MVDLKFSPSPEFFKPECRNDCDVSVEMKSVWAVELDLAQELLRVCKKHNLKMFADFGTLLGAARHKGFIPWDDDMDFSMLREDYEKLCSIAPYEFKHPYFFQYSNSGKEFINGHAKLRNSMTTGIVKDEMKRNLNYNQGIFIDILPIDNVSDNEFVCFAQMRLAHFFWFLMLCFAYFSSRYFESDSIWRIPKKIVHILFNRPFKLFQFWSYKLWMFFCKLYSSKRTKNVAGMSFPNVIKKQLRSDYEQDVMTDFEFTSLPIMKNYDRVLTRWFGEWRVPKMMKNSHGDVFFDVNVPYTKYLPNFSEGSE
ncbi:MAG: LicD family protein [Fibrobacter sp.]|nr:LicD family protein [Fibrobacter sp.]MBQ3839236.1 LicD family protein [Fibrobacter sp.]MBR2898034.1 LicD family protein [Fibrobacter sp.]